MPAKTRVLFAIGSLDSGGSERQLVEILRRIDRQRFTPLLYLIYRRGELLEELPDDVETTAYWDRFRRPRLNFPGRILRSQGRDLAGQLRRLQADVLCDRNFNVSLPSAIAVRRRPTARVAIVDCDPQPDLTTSGGRFISIKRRMLQQAYRDADRVVAVSQGVRQGVQSFYQLPEDNLVVIENFIDIQRIDRLAAEEGPPMPGDRFHVVAVGRLAEQKGYSHLLRAVADLVHRRDQRRLLLWIVGAGPLDQSLQRLAAELQIAEHVRFEGFQANPLPYLKSAQLYCLPSLYEGMPNALAEAMVCEIPVVASDCPSGPREMLAGGELGRLVPPADPQALAEAILEAIRDRPRLAALCPAARRHIEQKFSVEVCLPRYEAVLEQLGERGR